MTDFSEEMEQVNSMYICDVGGERSSEPVVCEARTVVLSSPDTLHYHEWLKQPSHTTLHMPSWSFDEVTAVVPTVFPQRWLADGVTSIYPARFKLYGGIARTIFSIDDDEELQHQLTSYIESCDLNALLKSIQSGRRLGPLQHLVDFVIGSKADGSPNFRKATIDFASDEICRRVMEQKEQHEQDQIVSFLMGSAGKPDVASMRGKAFEHWAHRVLSHGGTFRMRWEDDQGHNDFDIKFAPSVLKGITSSLTTLAAGVRQRIVQRECLIARVVTSFSHPACVCVCVCVCVCACVCVCVCCRSTLVC
jgi:hypothetical protein